MTMRVSSIHTVILSSATKSFTTSTSTSTSTTTRHLLDDEDPHHFTMTKVGLMITTFTAVLSSCSSMLILYVIFKAPQKLTTTYHRIMALMSVFDIMASVSMALTTLPMPTDDSIPFAGKMLGNPTTCSLQGYFLILGLSGSSSLYICLSWYFVLKMSFMMDLHTIKKYVEPIFYIFTLGIAFGLSSYYLSKDLYHTVASDPFCGIGPSHSGYLYIVDIDTFRLSDSNETQYFHETTEFIEFEEALNVIVYIIGFAVFMVILAMLIIIWTISKKNCGIIHALKQNHNNKTRPKILAADETPGEIHDDQEEKQERDNMLNLSELRYSRVIVTQALMYIFAYLLTWVFMVVPMIVTTDRSTVIIMEVMKCILFPLQGFWNLIIFMFDKAYLVYQKDEHNGICDVLRLVILHPNKTSDIILPATFTRGNDRTSFASQDAGSNKSPNLDTDVENSNDKGVESSVSTLSSEIIKRDGLYFLGKENRRFYADSKGLRRTGEVVDKRIGREPVVNSSISIESPVGCMSSSLVDESSSSFGTSGFLPVFK